MITKFRNLTHLDAPTEHKLYKICRCIWICLQSIRTTGTYEENNNIVLIIDPTSTQRHVAFLLRQLSIGSETALWFALTTMWVDYSKVLSNWSYLFLKTWRQLIISVDTVGLYLLCRFWMMDRSSLLASRMCIVGRDMIYNFKFILVDKKIENLCAICGHTSARKIWFKPRRSNTI